MNRDWASGFLRGLFFEPSAIYEDPRTAAFSEGWFCGVCVGGAVFTAASLGGLFLFLRLGGVF